MSPVMSLVIVAALVASPLPAEEPWQLEAREAPTGGESTVAFVDNDGGFRFSVVAGPSRYSANCRLTLPEDSSESLAFDSPVVLSVDGQEPLTVLRWQGQLDEEDGEDFLEVMRRASSGVPLAAMNARWVSFQCWPALAGQQSPASGALRQILDGRALVVRFGTVDGGVQQETFSLEAARETIADALKISAVPSSTDIAQDELLKFRCEYRSKTCYLLAGRKRRKRCLQAVNRCAERTHDSVLSMLECIEGK